MAQYMARPVPKMSPRTPHMLCVTTRQRQWLRPCDTAPDEDAGSKASHLMEIFYLIALTIITWLGLRISSCLCLPVTELQVRRLVVCMYVRPERTEPVPGRPAASMATWSQVSHFRKVCMYSTYIHPLPEPLQATDVPETKE